NFDQIVGKIRAMHAVGQPPMAGTDCSAFRYLKEAHIPYSRLHDVGIYKLLPMVDISCIFPDFSKDEQDPANYDFEYTDYLISEMMNNDCPPIFRLGETIENAVDRGFRPRYIHAPADPHKWARICEQIIRHYNEGWADGFRFGIRYWEIWNEADNGFQVGEGPVKAGGPYRDINHMWVGSFRQCYELYVIAAKHLKACFGDQIMVGGYGSSGLYAIFIEPEKYGAPVALQKNYRPRYELMLQFFYEFLDYVKEQNAPLDFFSWHSYSDVDRSVAMEQFVERTLRERGFDCEILLDEWNNAPAPEKIGTSYAAAHAAAMLLAMQNTELTVMNYYDARIVSGDYCGMFNPVLRTPYCLYYAFKAFGELYCLGDQAKCTVEGEGLYAVAATNGGKKAVLLTNIGADQRVETNLQGFEVYLIDETHRMERVDWDPSSFELKENQTVYLVK
ncbi:MAG: hypothetical protein IJP27_08240, partial [Clostridia bacterium]|nr:hypothetical protein [Clostridia bacterium]